MRMPADIHRRLDSAEIYIRLAERMVSRRRASGADPSAPLVTREEALEIAELPASAHLAVLNLGGMARELFLTRPGFRCGIINAKSGRCPENCAFCAQSRSYRTSAPVYPMADAQKLLEGARKLEEAGAARYGIVTSGRGPSNRDVEALEKAAAEIAARTRIGLCASLGILSRERAERLRRAGFTSYHHNLETGRTFFPKICSTHPYDLDVETVRVAKEAGFRVCSGGLFGLGESWADRIELAFELSDLKVDSIPVNFLIPIPGTPLENRPLLEPMEALRIVALLRLVHPTKDIIICGGRSKILGESWQSWVYAAGANAVMTGDYLTQKGNAFEKDRALVEALGAEG